MEKKKHMVGYFIFSSVLTLVLVYFLIKQVKISDIFDTIKLLPWYILIIIFLVYIIIYIFRTLRFSLLLDKKIKFRNIFNIMSIHNFLNNMLPMRVGEFSYPYLLKKQNIKVNLSIFSLIVSRVCDFFIISLFFLIALLFLDGFSPLVNYFLKIISFFFFLAFILLALFMFGGPASARIINLLFLKFRLKRFRLGRGIFKQVNLLIENFNKLNFSTLFKVLSLTLLLWFFSYAGFYYLLFLGIGIKLSLAVIMASIALVQLSTLLPIHGLMQFGTYETVWVLAFVLFGLPKDLAIISGFSFHVIRILFLVLLAIFGFVNSWLIRTKAV